MALAQVRAAVPASQSVSIHCEVWSHAKALLRRHDSPIEVSYRVWDGNSVFAAASLEQAVSACLAAHHPSKSAPEQAREASGFFSQAGALAAASILEVA